MTSLRDRLGRGEKFLQVALDYTDASSALHLASLLRRELGAEGWLAEAGTPLVKAEGVGVVSLLRSVVDPVPVVADMKTADTGSLEAGLALGHGASITTVLACADDATIAEAARRAHEAGGLVAADLIGVRDPLARAEELEQLGVDIVELHVGIDAQRALGITAVEMRGLVRRLSKKLNAYIAVAGGLNEKTAPEMAAAGASIVIVGGAITKSENPSRVARAIIEKIRPNL